MDTNSGGNGSDTALWSGVKLFKKYDVPTDETYELMVAALSSDKGAKSDGIHSTEKFKIRSKFVLVNQDGVQYVCGKDSRKPVLKQSQVAEVLREHHDGKGHPGRISVISTIKNAYHSIPQALVEKYIKNCQKCASRAPLPKPPTGKAIRAKGVMVRLQADLIDMSSVPDGDIKYILQVKDHMSKFIWVFGLERKACAGVAACIRQIFLQFGPCRILQMDNGGEFTGSAMTTMLAKFPCVKVVHGRPRHPQSQGLVERANQTLERRLGAWIQDNGSTGWSIALPELALAINSSYNRVIKMIPFELMFARKAREPKAVEILDDDDDGEVKWVEESEEEENPGEGHRGVHQEGARQEVQPGIPGAPEAGVPPAGPIPPGAPEAGVPPAVPVPPGALEVGVPPAGLGEVQHRDGHRGVYQEGVRQEVQPGPLGAVEAGVPPAGPIPPGAPEAGVPPASERDAWLAANGPCLLFEREPEVRAVAIGFIAELPSVHNHEVLSSERCIVVAEVLTDEPPLMPPFSEPLIPKTFVKWPKALLALELGSTVENVRMRAAPFIAYEKDRVKQDNHYQEQRKRINFNPGDFVAMKIPRVDRANIDAVNMPACVLSNEDDYLTLQSPAGIISTKIQGCWPALRSTTAYGADKGSVCNCKSGCGTKRCKCVIAGLNCSTKCHKGSDCVNKNTENL